MYSVVSWALSTSALSFYFLDSVSHGLEFTVSQERLSTSNLPPSTSQIPNAGIADVYRQTGFMWNWGQNGAFIPAV